MDRESALFYVVLLLFAATGIVTSMVWTGRPAFMGTGRPQIVFHMQVARAATIFLFIYPLSARWGFAGAASAILLSQTSAHIVYFVNIRRQFGITWKDMGLMFMTYGYVYVAQVALGADPMQTMKAFIEAESYDGPSIIIAYSHCIAHGFNMMKGLGEQKKAVDSGHWPLYRFNPTLREKGEHPLTLDSRAPSLKLEEYIYGENRYRILQKANPERAKEYLDHAQRHAEFKYKLYKQLSEMECK
jgi:hypothetical protein